jgi:hypothetical protein
MDRPTILVEGVHNRSAGFGSAQPTRFAPQTPTAATSSLIGAEGSDDPNLAIPDTLACHQASRTSAAARFARVSATYISLRWCSVSSGEPKNISGATTTVDADRYLRHVNDLPC